MKKLSIFLLGLLACSGSALDLPETIDRIRPSVVGIGTVMPPKRLKASGPALKFFGTGFVVGNGRQVITNHHVIDGELDPNQKEKLVVFVGRGKDSQIRQAKILESDAQHDIALLGISGDPLAAMTLSAAVSVREGQEVAFTGFPIGIVLGPYPVTHKAIVSAITPVVIPANSSGSLTAEQIKRMRDPFEVYQLDAIAYPGSSGSPVYEVATGKVIGIVNSVFVKETRESVLQKPSGIVYAIPVRYVVNLLEQSK